MHNKLEERKVVIIVGQCRLYASQLQNLFLPGELLALDEFGVPLPLVQRLSQFLPVDDIAASRRMLDSPNVSVRGALSSFELQLLALQLPFMQVSESMGNHDSKIVDAASVD
jgi:hypothetical protein